GEARTADLALVEEHVEIPASGHVRRAPLPRLGNEPELAVVEFRERPRVARAVDDDLLPLERGVEVGDDAHPPAGPVARLTRGQRERLGRRALLPAFAERARVELLLRG